MQVMCEIGSVGEEVIMTDDKKIQEMGKIAIRLNESEVDLKSFQQRWDVTKELPPIALNEMMRMVRGHNKLVKKHNRLCDPEFKVTEVLV